MVLLDRSGGGKRWLLVEIKELDPQCWWLNSIFDTPKSKERFKFGRRYFEWIIMCFWCQAFTRWVNSHLATKGKSIESVHSGFENGVNLLLLLETLSRSKISDYNKNPPNTIVKLENLTTALKWMKNHAMSTVNIGANGKYHFDFSVFCIHFSF